MQTEKLYVEGRRFRVIKEGARFEGLLLYGEQSMSGWSRKILPGEILTCLGWQEVEVFGTHVAGIMWTGPKVPDNAMVMQVWPFESLFRPFPMRGVMEPYVEPAEDEEPELAPDLEEDDDIEDLTEHLPAVLKALATSLKDEEEEIVDLRGF